MRPLIAAALALAAAPAAAQQTPPPDSPGSPLLTATVSQGFSYDTNYGLQDPRRGGSFYADTRLGLGLLSETELQTLSIGLDTGLRALWEADEDFRFTFASPSTADLDYARDWASGGLDLGLRYRQTEVDADRDFGEVFEEGEVVTEDDLERLNIDVTQYRYDANIGLELAQDAPSSYTFSLAGTRIDYDEVTGDRTPRDSAQAQAGWRLRFNDTVSGALNGLYIYYDADNPAQTLVRFASFDAGVIYEPSEVLRLDLGAGYSHRERRETVDRDTDPTRESDSDSGPAARFALRYAFEDVTVDGVVRYTAAADGAPVTGRLRATYPLPRGTISGQLFQNKTGSSSGSEARVTGLELGLTRDLSAVSLVEFDAAAAQQVDETAPFEEDITRYSFTATYSHAVTQNVAASLGYSVRTFDQGDEYAVSNLFFFQIGRTFQTRP